MTQTTLKYSIQNNRRGGGGVADYIMWETLLKMIHTFGCTYVLIIMNRVIIVDDREEKKMSNKQTYKRQKENE